MKRARAVTLLEMLVVVGIIGIAAVAGTRVLAHCLRLSERAQVRSELTAVAQAELEQMRIMASLGEEDLSLSVNDRDGIRLNIDGWPDETTGLIEICVSAESTRSVYPLSVTLHGWVMPPGDAS